METAASTAWAPGVTFGHYTLLAKLATGGMAEIWLARQTGLKGFERIVVIKRIIESLSADESFVEMFLDEARIVVQLTHPNIVQVFDLGEFGGAYYIAMEYLAGEHLASLVRAAAKAHQPLPPQVAVRLVISALDGLIHAHGRIGVDGKPLNIIHRDVSPQNIVLTWDGQVKLLDFGIARAANRATQTQGNQLKGKYAYMAPEQAHGDVELDPRADVFGMGIVLWELVTFRRLHGTDDAVQILKSLISDTPILSAHARNPRVPAELSDIIDRALQKRREDRFADAGAFKEALETWLKTNGGGPSTAELAGMMQQLFSDRIAERKQLIENAAKGIATTTQVTEALKPTTNRSMPGDTGLSSRRGRLIALGALGALLLLLIGGAVKILLGRTETVVAEVAPTPAAPIPATIVVETEPSGATITLDGTAAGTSPVTLKEERTGEHLIAASLAGHNRVTRTFSVKGEGESLVLVLSLPALPVEVPLKTDAGTGAPEVRKVDAPRVGRLSLNTDPWTRVALNGRPLGDTPLLEVPLPVGRHRLKLTNDEAKIDVAIEVEIKAGQLTKKVLRL
jgi:serine/threonine-protein kinase